MTKTNWNEQFKIRLAKSDESMDKHDILKILIVRKILRTYRKRHFLRIYTEFSMNHGTGLKPDIYMENLKDKSIICWEIQKELTPKYMKEQYERYSKVKIPFFNEPDVIFVPLKKCPDSIQEINKFLDDYVA